MQTNKSFLAFVTAAALLGGTALVAQGPPPPRPDGYYQGGEGYHQDGQGYNRDGQGYYQGGSGYQGQGWENAPPEFQAIERRGFHDGIEGARKDFGNHRPPNVNNREEFRHPSVSGADRRAYRDAFRRGYDVGVQHIYQGR